jgi:Carbonic anhydrase
MSKISLFLLGIVLFGACSNSPESATGKASSYDVVSSSVLTAEEQAKLTPDIVLNMLKVGNQEFVDDNLTILNRPQRVRDAVSGQHPKAAILSCLDSRVPVEDVFHQGIGDLFVARIAGNFVNDDILGSLEYACKVSGSKLIVVLGHEHCGAIKSAINDVKLGNITTMLEKIKPAVTNASQGFTGDKTSSNHEFVEAVCSHNVHHAIEQIRAKSPILKEMEDNGEIKIVGGVYQMETGKVEFIN